MNTMVTILSASALFCMVLSAPAYADQTEEMMRMIQELKAKVEHLEKQLAQQAREDGNAAANAAHSQPDHVQAMDERLKQLEEAKESSGSLGGVEFHGVVEVEATSGDDHTGNDGSDITLATVELGFDFTVFNDWVTGTFMALHEDDATDNWEVDQALFTIGNIAEYPLYLSAGRMYVPFGNFETNLVSDPLTLEIGETREAAILAGFEKDHWYGSGYVFNGDLDEFGDDHVENYGFNLGYAKATDDQSFDIGLSWINHIGDADGIEDAVSDTNGNGNAGPVRDYVAAWGLHGIYRLGPWSFIGEYIKAGENFTAAELGWKARGAQPSAYNLEVGYDFEAFGGRASNVALAVQGTGEAVALELPEHKWLAGFNTTLYRHTSLALEYAYAEDYGISEGGTGKDGDALTLQVAVEF